jgi:PqqD family protein of HPr-rel-A system
VDATPRYCADPPGALIVTPLDALTSIYHRSSGITHIVGEPVPQILDVLAGGPLSVTELLATLSGDHDVVADGDTLAALQSRIDELLESGLVRRA